MRGAHIVSGGGGGAGGVDTGTASVLRERSQQHKKESKVIEEVFQLLKDVAVLYERENQADKVQELQNGSKELMELLAKMDVNTKIINEMHQGAHVRSREPMTEFMARRLGELESSVNPDSFQRHPLWTGMRQDLWAVHHPDSPLPELAGDEVAVVGGRKLNLTCPLTQMDLEDPVRAAVCGHTFSRNAIEKYLQRKAANYQQGKCPVPGCDAVLSIDALERDVEAERQLQKKQTAGKKRGRPGASLSLDVLSQSQGM